jgi:hypothetical protein
MMRDEGRDGIRERIKVRDEGRRGMGSGEGRRRLIH